MLVLIDNSNTTKIYQDYKRHSSYTKEFKAQTIQKENDNLKSHLSM